MFDCCQLSAVSDGMQVFNPFCIILLLMIIIITLCSEVRQHMS